jgi:hypothetical protein
MEAALPEVSRFRRLKPIIVFVVFGAAFQWQRSRGVAAAGRWRDEAALPLIQSPSTFEIDNRR